METQAVTRQSAALGYSTPRARAVSLIGPLAVFAGIVWAILQPYRLTLLHPHHQGFWWLVIEPPLLVAATGLFFALVIARPLIGDLEGGDGAP